MNVNVITISRMNSQTHEVNMPAGSTQHREFIGD